MRLIDADALVKYFEGLAVSLANVECFAAADAMQTTAETLKLATAIDAEPVRHGRWISNTYSISECSACKQLHFAHVDSWNYCPNCGAKMDEEDSK